MHRLEILNSPWELAICSNSDFLPSGELIVIFRDFKLYHTIGPACDTTFCTAPDENDSVNGYAVHVRVRTLSTISAGVVLH